MKNCTFCNFAGVEKCECKKSQYYNDYINEYMICREFEEKKKENVGNKQ